MGEQESLFSRLHPFCHGPGVFPDYYRYATRLAERYKDWIKVYSVWNEVDSSWFQGGTAGDYAET